MIYRNESRCFEGSRGLCISSLPDFTDPHPPSFWGWSRIGTGLVIGQTRSSVRSTRCGRRTSAPLLGVGEGCIGLGRSSAGIVCCGGIAPRLPRSPSSCLNVLRVFRVGRSFLSTLSEKPPLTTTSFRLVQLTPFQGRPRRTGFGAGASCPRTW